MTEPETATGLRAGDDRGVASRAVEEYEALLERISGLAQALATARDLETIFRYLRDFAVASTPANGMFISLYDPDRNERSAVYAWTDGGEIDVSGLPPMPMSGSPHSRAVATNSVVFADDFQAAMQGQPVVHVGLDVDPRLPQSSLVVPMAIMGRVIGGIEVQSVAPAAFEARHATSMRMAANVAAIATENVRMLEREISREQQLRLSQKMEAVGRLAGGVAHDFNNLLTVISGYSEFVLRQLDPSDPLRRDVGEIRRAGLRAADLTRQLLAFSRHQVLAPRVVDLGATVTGLARMLRRVLGEDVELTVRRHPNLGCVLADPGQIEQVILNLAVNSRDAMPNGGLLIVDVADVCVDERSAKLGAGPPPGRYVRITVTDTGVGMDEDTQSKVFEPFFTTKEIGKGTGLGLSTVYGIVKQSGGTIEVTSEAGIGTAFTIHLPCVEGRAEPVAAAADPPELSLGTGAVLVVEDDPAVRKLTVLALERAGYRTLEASSAIEALEVVDDAGRIDLVVTDVVMPRMSGRQLADRLAAIRPDVKILFMSGYNEDAIDQHGVFDCHHAFIAKPFTPGDLADRVRDLLDAPPHG